MSGEKNTFKLDEKAKVLWDNYQALQENKTEILKRRFFNNYPMEERIEYLQHLQRAHNEFWSYARLFLPKKHRTGDIRYNREINTITLLGKGFNQ